MGNGVHILMLLCFWYLMVWMRERICLLEIVHLGALGTCCSLLTAWDVGIAAGHAYGSCLLCEPGS